MWYTQKTSREVHTNFASSVRELLQSTFRNLILITGGIYLLWYFATTSSSAGQLSLMFLPLSALFLLTCALSLHLLSRRYMIAQIVWQIGVAGSITLGVYISQQPLVAFFFVLLPLMAVVTGDWLAGVLAEGVVIALVWWIVQNPVMPPLPPSFAVTIVLGGAFTGLLGWVASQTLVTAVEWSLYGVEQARLNLEEARLHRARLAKVLKDLDSAYHRLEQANSALLVARDAAIRAERFKAEFVANVSHELRTPLNLIIGFSEVMATAPESYGDDPLPNAYRGDVMAMYRSAQHLSDLIDDVLDLSQIESGRMPLNKEAVDLSEVVREADQIMRSLAEARELQLELMLEDHLPVLYLDRIRVRQVILNLLSNAMRYTDQGWIRVHARLEGQEAVVTVTDSGSGIPPDRLSNAFEAFSQLEEGHTYEGSGLGLALSKKFIELHGGKIWIESEPGRGTRVSFTLPIPEKQDKIYVTSPTTTSSIEYREGQPSVLILHDDPRVLLSLRRRIDGYQLLLADSIDKAREIIQDEFPVAVIMDDDWANRRDGCGSNVNLPAATPLITCPLPSPRHLGQLLGVADYLPKPVTRENLQDTLSRLPRSPQTILIIDDNPRIVRLLARLLKSIEPSFRFLEAFSGEEALKIVESQRPDVVLLDMALPDIDGHTVLEKITRNEAMAGTQIIITSGRDLEQELMPIKGELRLENEAGFSHDGIMNILEAMLTTATQLPTTAPPSGVVPQAVLSGQLVS